MRRGDDDPALAAELADGEAHLGRGAQLLEEVDAYAVGREYAGGRLGEEAGVVAAVVADADGLGALGERLVDVVGESLRGRAHGVYVHAVAADTHDAAQAPGPELQIVVERLDKLRRVLGVEHAPHLGARVLVVGRVQPSLGLLSRYVQNLVGFHILWF